MDGKEFDGSVVGLSGYKLVVTGGSDRDGFPMKRGVHGAARPKILMSGGVGYRAKSDVRVRKRVRGERIGEDVVQVNTKIVKHGRKDVEILFGLKEESAGEKEDGDGVKKEEKVEEGEEKKPKAEEKKEEKLKEKGKEIKEKAEEPKEEAAGEKEKKAEKTKKKPKDEKKAEKK
ncbi:MAG: hypothetical protein A7315_06470 [Candidatus Altiarchaeales archaeon WOR_SM1_79]|nr:MAG: hypothetical protein A7315_06470 [Candidatus Altiarchaeales archaeon WOR_SM1_79]